jgi:hypothetical protein
LISISGWWAQSDRLPGVDSFTNRVPSPKIRQASTRAGLVPDRCNPANEHAWSHCPRQRLPRLNTTPPVSLMLFWNALPPINVKSWRV